MSRWKSFAYRCLSLANQCLSLAVAVIFLLPLVWMFLASLRPVGLPPPRGIELLPARPAWENYARIFELLPLGRYTFNSLFVSTLAVPLTLLTASWAGFSMAQLGARNRRRLLLLSVALLMTPVTALWLTRFVLVQWLGIFNSYAALLFPTLMGSSPLFILLFYWAFRSVPAETFESARLDGAGILAIWWKVALPLARPTTVTVSVLTFLLYWNDFINPLLYLKSQRLYTLAVGLQQLQQMDRTNWPLLMAAATVMTLPTLALFFFVQRYFLHIQPR
jgi:multiple sugar transport system permease protein